MVMTVGERGGSVTQGWRSEERRVGKECVQHGKGSDGAHGLRGHQLGVGDIGPMQSRTRIRAQRSSDDYDGIQGGEHEPGMVSRCEWAQPDSSIQRSRDRRGVCDGAR